MAIGGFGGGLLAGLSGIAQGLDAAQKQRERETMNRINQQRLLDYARQDQASKALFGSLLGGMGDIDPMMVGGQPPMPGTDSRTIDMSQGADGSYSAPPAGSGMRSGLPSFGGGNPGSLAMAAPPEVQAEVAQRIGTTSGLQHWANFNPPLRAALQRAGLPLSGPVSEDQWRSADPLITQYESGNRNVPNYRFDAGHTAGGTHQITNSTWRAFGGPDWSGRQQPQQTASAGGVDINVMDGPEIGRSAPPMTATEAGGGDAPASSSVSDTGIDLPPEAKPAPTVTGDGKPYTPPTAQRAAPTLQQPPAAPPPYERDVQQTIRSTASTIPPQVYGRMSLSALARQIDKANPGMDPVVKMMALERAQKLMAPTELREWEMFKMQHNDEFQLRREQMAREERRAETAQSQQFQIEQGERTAARQQERDDRIAQRQQEHDERTAGRTGAQVMKDDDGTVYTMNPNIPNSARTLDGKPYAPKGATKVGTKGDLPKADPETVALLKDMLKSGLNPPSYMARGPQGQANLQQAMAEMGKEGVKGGDLALARADVRANQNSLSGLTRVYDQTKAFEGLAEKNLDAAVEAAAKTVPTDYGPFLNRWIMTGQTQFGDENVPAYTMLVVSSANELARVLSASTGAAAMTDTARREAAEVLSPYFSAGQFKAAATVAKQEMRRRIQELESGIGEIRGRAQTPGSATGGASPPTPPRTIEQKERQGVPAQGGGHFIGEVITAPNGKKYRVTGGNMADPDIEEVK